MDLNLLTESPDNNLLSTEPNVKAKEIKSRSSSPDSFSLDNFFSLMKYERLRLVSYILYQHQWPKMDVISPSELAKAGFFYLKGDSVQCAFCRGVIKNWETGDVAMEEHKKHFASCPFVKGKYVGNVSIELDPDINSNKVDNVINLPPTQEPIKVNYNKGPEPKFSLFLDLQTRKRSFTHKSWPKTNDKDKLADAGFFFTGKDDCTRCFHCGGLLFNWKQTEIPMEEHAKFFPECNFLITLKGQTYLEFVQFKKEIIELRDHMETSQNLKTKDIDSMRKITFENFISMKQSASKLLGKLQKLDNNETSDSSTYYKEYLKKFFFLVDCQKMFQYLLGMNVIKDEDETSSVFSLDSGNSSGDSDYASLDNLSIHDKAGSSGDRQDKSKLSCIICYDKQIEVVFLPCGHQLACLKCAQKISVCPICRSTIGNKVRTYFAFVDC